MKGTAKTFMRPQVLVKLFTKYIHVFLHEKMAAQYKNPPAKFKAGKEEGDRIEKMSTILFHFISNGDHKRANLLNQSSNYDPITMEARHTTDRQSYRLL